MRKNFWVIWTTKVGKFGGSSWIGVVTPLLSNFCFLKLFYREAQGLFLWFLVNFNCQPVHSSHLVVICELHLSLRFLSGLEPHSHFWQLSDPSGEAFFQDSLRMLVLTMTQILEFVFGVVSGFGLRPPSFANSLNSDLILLTLGGGGGWIMEFGLKVCTTFVAFSYFCSFATIWCWFLLMFFKYLYLRSRVWEHNNV